ncbi:hypothetical protein LCGC14_0993850 [marine sediment metagenome]|uniref:Uncharacterized protein n=1 Tax=marine sediment metagenome TaxID=412755 RepID=A0A0F9N9K1_9ZZZZ
MKISPSFILIIILILLAVPLIDSQLVGTQLIDLSEKARDFFVEATKGNIQGQQTGNQFGENLDVGVSEEDIQTQGGVLIFLQSAEKIEIISTDTVNDIFGGANAHTVEITGLDENFSVITETINLGPTVNTTTNEFIRVLNAEVIAVGTYSVTNLGTISMTAANSSTLQLEIAAIMGKSASTHFTVPAGQNLILTALAATMDTGKAVNVFLHIRNNADVTSGELGPEITIRTFRGLDTPVRGRSLGNLRFDEKTDIWFDSQITSGGAGASVEVNYDFVLYAIGT